MRIDDEICHCECHKSDTGLIVRHVIACCHKCEYCGQNITRYHYDEHVKKCERKNSNQTELILGSF